MLEIRKLLPGNEELEKYVLDKLNDYHKTQFYQDNWTNNNCESMNNLIKGISHKKYFHK